MNRPPRIYSTNIAGVCMCNHMTVDENKAIEKALAHAYGAWEWLGFERASGRRDGLRDYRPGVRIFRQQEGADGYHNATEEILFSGPDPQPGRAPIRDQQYM